MNRPYGRRPPYRRRDRLGFACTTWLMIFGAILGFAVYNASHARATTPPAQLVDVCFELRVLHTPLSAIETQLEMIGLSPRAAGIYTGTAVRAHCPEMTGWIMGEIV